MRLRPWFAWALAFGCLGWQLAARVGVFFSNLSLQSLWSFPVAVAGAGAITGLVVAAAPVMLGRGRPRLLVCLMAVLGFAPFLAAGPAWPAGPNGLLAAAVLLAFRGRVAWPLFGAITLLDAILGATASGEGVIAFANRVPVTVIVGLTLFAITRLARLIQAADDTRRRIARAEAAAERLRSASRLRVVLGTQLSHLVQRIRTLPPPADRTGEDLAGVAALARHTAAEARRLATSHTGPGQSQTDRQPTAPATYALAWSVSLVLIGCYSAVALVNLAWLGETGTATWLGGTAAVCASALLQLYHGTPRAGGNGPRWWPWTLAAQAALLAVTTATLGGLSLLVLWLPMAGALVAWARRQVSVPLLAGTVAVVLYAAHVTGGEAWNGWSRAYLVGTLAVAVISVYALCSLPATAQRLHDSRADLARTAMMAARLRFARDVHDLLGFHLATIAVKIDLAARTLDSDPQRAHQEVLEARRCAERALAEIRSIHHAADEVSSAVELAAARSLLAAAGVAVTVHMPASPAPEIDHLVGIIIREAATNVVRHSHARRCAIVATVSLGMLILSITNDGLPRAAGGARTARRDSTMGRACAVGRAGAVGRDSAVGRAGTAGRDSADPPGSAGPGAGGARLHAGTGIASLAARAAAAGGTVTATSEDGAFTLTVGLPVAVRAAAGARAGRQAGRAAGGVPSQLPLLAESTRLAARRELDLLVDATVPRPYRRRRAATTTSPTR